MDARCDTSITSYGRLGWGEHVIYRRVHHIIIQLHSSLVSDYAYATRTTAAEAATMGWGLTLLVLA